jgi:hypothetical protein
MMFGWRTAQFAARVKPTVWCDTAPGLALVEDGRVVVGVAGVAVLVPE